MSWMFGFDTSVATFTPIEDWNIPNTVNIGGIFTGIDSSVTRPSWGANE
jgi:hypothetical protein